MKEMVCVAGAWTKQQNLREKKINDEKTESAKMNVGE